MIRAWIDQSQAVRGDVEFDVNAAHQRYAICSTCSMKTSRLINAAAVLATVVLASASSDAGGGLSGRSVSAQESGAAQDTDLVRAQADGLAGLINRERVAEGLAPMARSVELDRAAQEHSRDMAENDFLEHEGSDGSIPQERAARAGYIVPADSGWLVVELISAISAQPDGPLNWWLYESPQTHGKHLRDARYREFGVGYASGGSYGNYWTLLVGCRPDVLPVIEFEGATYWLGEGCDRSRLSEPSTGDLSGEPDRLAE